MDLDVVAKIAKEHGLRTEEVIWDLMQQLGAGSNKSDCDGGDAAATRPVATPPHRTETKDQTSASPTWMASSWLTSLSLIQILSKSLLGSGKQQTDLERIKTLNTKSISEAVDNASRQWKVLLCEAVADLRNTECADASLLNDKFASDGDSFTFRYGGMEQYHGGLEALIGNPDPRVGEAMRWEHMESPFGCAEYECWWTGKTTACKEYEYVVHGVANESETLNGRRESGNHGRPLQSFVDSTEAQAAGLKQEEVIALRLYTGPMYVWYNYLLRYRHAYNPTAYQSPFDDYKLDESDFPFRTTLHVLNSAIIKLSRTQRAEKVYRGTKGGCLPPQFWEPNEQNVRGGIELGFMSTTTERKVAMSYAKAEIKPSIVFEMQMGMIDRGAPLQWCSQFPNEAEILFAPLTGLEVVGTPRVEDSVIIVQLRLNCNLHDLTIEQILSKMYTTHFDLVNIVKSDLSLLGFPKSACGALKQHEEAYRKRDPEWFNAASNYIAATERALELKFEACTTIMLANSNSSNSKHRLLSASGQCSSKEQDLEKVAVAILLDPTDASALQYGIDAIIKHKLVGLYKDELEEVVSQSKSLAGLSLQFKNRGLTGPVPEILLRLCAQTSFFDLSENNFEIPTGSLLAHIVSHVHHLRDETAVAMIGKKDLTCLNGVQYYPALESCSMRGSDGIIDVTQLASCVGLLRLDLWHLDALTNISALGSCHRLEYLDLSFTSIKDLSPLKNLSNLKQLFAQQCFKLDDISGLSGCVALEMLSLRRCRAVVDLTALASCTSLQELNLRGCGNVADISALTSCMDIRNLNLCYCGGVVDITPLLKLPLVTLGLANIVQPSWIEVIAKHFPRVRELDIGLEHRPTSGAPKGQDSWGRQLSQSVWSKECLNTLAQLELTGLSLACTATDEWLPLIAELFPEIKDLNLSRCPLSDVSALIACSNLQILDLNECASLSDIEALAKCTDLEKLAIRKTAVTDISSLASCKKLRDLDYTYCHVNKEQGLALLRALPEVTLWD
jgi:Leucine-rich repeat (LRR) protein